MRNVIGAYFWICNQSTVRYIHVDNREPTLRSKMNIDTLNLSLLKNWTWWMYVIVMKSQKEGCILHSTETTQTLRMNMYSCKHFISH